ncbi:MAG: DUF5350 domain-containing protein [Methanomicrobiales archaeon]|nr:DUF5350 domain-containing protein [Methanomicrobiales archaeon]
MGKTGTTNWMQVKGVKGQIRLVPQKDAEVKKPGPNQRFKPSATIRKFSRRSEEEQQGRGPRRAPRGRGGRGRRGEMKDQRLRRRIRRSKVSQMGAKQKAKK